jgi:hypothetical protein
MVLLPTATDRLSSTRVRTKRRPNGGLSAEITPGRAWEGTLELDDMPEVPRKRATACQVSHPMPPDAQQLSVPTLMKSHSACISWPDQAVTDFLDSPASRDHGIQADYRLIVADALTAPSSLTLPGESSSTWS